MIFSTLVSCKGNLWWLRWLNYVLFLLLPSIFPSFLHSIFSHTYLFTAGIQCLCLSQVLKSLALISASPVFCCRCTCLHWPSPAFVFSFSQSLVFVCSSQNMEPAAFLNLTWFPTHRGHRFSLFPYTRDSVVALSSLRDRMPFISKGNRWSLFLVETMRVAVHLGEDGLILAFWSSETWKMNRMQQV